MNDERPTEPKYQDPLTLTDEQVKFIEPLLKMERPGAGEVKMIFAQVRSAPWPNHGKVQIAFCLVDAKTAGKVLKTIEESKTTRYAPGGSLSNYVQILPQGEPIFILKNKQKGPKNVA